MLCYCACTVCVLGHVLLLLILYHVWSFLDSTGHGMQVSMVSDDKPTTIEIIIAFHLTMNFTTVESASAAILMLVLPCSQ